MLTKDKKEQIIKEAAVTEKDTGSSKVQIALLDARISQISVHLKQFPKDKHSHCGLIKLLGRKRALTKYMERKSCK